MQRITGPRDQKNRTRANTESPIIRNACIHLNPHPLTMPRAISSHFHGSVSQTNKGIQDARRVTPVANAYTAKNFANATRLPMVIVMTIKPIPARTKGMAMELTNNMPTIRTGLSWIQVRLAPEKKRLDVSRKPEDFPNPTSLGNSLKKWLGEPKILVRA